MSLIASLPRFRQVKFNRPVFRRKVIAFANVTNLDARAATGLFVPTNRPSAETYRVPRPFLRQPAAALCVAQIAELLQLVLRRNRFIVTRRARSIPSPMEVESHAEKNCLLVSLPA